MSVDKVLSAAVVEYLRWTVAKMPTADAAAVSAVAEAAGVGERDLLKRVTGAVADSDALSVADLEEKGDAAADVYKERLRRARPDLSPRAIDALASRWFYRSRWLGISAGRDGTRYFVLFGGDGAIPVPVALFRRRIDAGTVHDESLKDVGEWRAETRGLVDRAIVLPLDSDLDEVTADQAREFEQMVESGHYVPFRSVAGRPIFGRPASWVYTSEERTPMAVDWAHVRQKLTDAGIPPLSVVLPGDRGPAWQGALHVSEQDGRSWILETVDYGRRRRLLSRHSAEEIVTALRAYLLSPLPAPVDLPVAERERLLEWSAPHLVDLAARADRPLLIDAPAGLLLDRIGALDGFFLYAAETSFEARSLPVSALDQPVTTLLTAGDIRFDVERTPPWFGRPGGGLRFSIVEPGMAVRDLVREGLATVVAGPLSRGR